MEKTNKKITDYDEFVETLGQITDNIDTKRNGMDCLLSVGCFDGQFLAQAKGSVNKIAHALATVFAEAPEVYKAAQMAVYAMDENGDKIKSIVKEYFNTTCSRQKDDEYIN